MSNHRAIAGGFIVLIGGIAYLMLTGQLGAITEDGSTPGEGGGTDDVDRWWENGYSPVMSSGAWTSSGTWSALAIDAGTRYGIRPELVEKIIAKESSGNPTARNPTTSARGLMQVTKAAAIDVGADWDSLDDPAANVEAGTAYLALMVGEFGEYDGVRAYHAGPGTIRRGTNAALLAQADAYAAAIYA